METLTCSSITMANGTTYRKGMFVMAYDKSCDYKRMAQVAWLGLAEIGVTFLDGPTVELKYSQVSKA